MNAETSQPNWFSLHARSRRIWLTAWLALAGVFGLMGLGRWSQPEASSNVTLASVSPPVLPTRNIEDVQLGDRLAGRNPLREEVDESLPGPDPETWRKISFRMYKDSGDPLDIELLRPIEWIEASGAQHGNTIFLNLPEMGAVGNAEVLSVDICPPIKRGDGNVVTGRFRHRSSGNLLNVRLEGEPDPTGVTAEHPYWSVDRQAFVKAGELGPGERLDTAFGTTKVASVTPRPTDEPVYNLEVHGEHVYRVGKVGTLVHNSYIKIGPRWRARAATDPKVQSGCDKVAKQIKKLIGGTRSTITTPGRSLGGFKGSPEATSYHYPEWINHEVVVKGGRVYDAFTGYKGLPIQEYKSLWESAAAIGFKF